jgi:prophage antirepressor-like protein
MKTEQFTFNDKTIDVHPTQDARQWFMTVEEVARAYGVERHVILNALRRHSDELREEHEKGVTNCYTLGGSQETRVIYREGVIKIGFFIRGERAKAFRQFATTLVVQHLDRSGSNSAEGYERLLSKFERMEAKMESNMRGMESNLSHKLDDLVCGSKTAYGDDQDQIHGLVAAVAEGYGVDGRTVWGWIQTECDVASYKKQNVKIINFLRSKLNRLNRPCRLVANNT